MRKRTNGEGSIYYTIRNGRKYYTAQVTVGIDSFGKQIRKSVSSYDKSKVIQGKKEIETDIALGKYSVNNNITFGDFFMKWLYNYKRVEIGERTFAKYETDYRLRISQSDFIDKKLHEISTMDLQKYVNQLIEKGNSIETTKRSLRQVKLCLDFALKDNLIYYNPADNVTTPKRKEKPKSYGVYSLEEQKNIISKLNLRCAEDFAIYLGFNTGLRLGEFLALEWSDYDRSENVLSVTKQFQKLYVYDNSGNKKLVKKTTPLKTLNSTREVPLPDVVCDKLEWYKIDQDEHKEKYKEYYTDRNLILADDKGNYLDTKVPNRRLKKICKELGIEPRPVHALRHSYATRLFEQGVSPKTVQMLLGHSNIDTTLNIYTHVFNDTKKSAVDTLDNIY